MTATGRLLRIATVDAETSAICPSCGSPDAAVRLVDGDCEWRMRAPMPPSSSATGALGILPCVDGIVERTEGAPLPQKGFQRMAARAGYHIGRMPPNRFEATEDVLTALERHGFHPTVVIDAGLTWAIGRVLREPFSPWPSVT